MAAATDLSLVRVDSTTIESSREALIAEQITALQGLIATAKDEKVKLGAIAEMNRMLAVGSYKAAVSNKQVNNFLNDRPRPTSTAAVAARLDATASVVERLGASEEHAAVLASLEDGDDGE